MHMFVQKKLSYKWLSCELKIHEKFMKAHEADSFMSIERHGTAVCQDFEPKAGEVSNTGFSQKHP